ncbi:MAG: DUF493 family protein [Capnocytophaga sp.]|nr:DUF493 family protein [Capnocytophaga sp.]
MTNEEIEKFYEKLKNELIKTTIFPSEYLYKFILPSSEDKKKELYKIFEGKDAKITEKESSNGKFTSFSIRITLQNPDEVIYFYKEAGKIDGIVSL